MTTFSTGDVVQSKIGGPHMVVHELTAVYKSVYTATGMADQLPCQWYDGDKFTVTPQHASSLRLIRAYQVPEQSVVFEPGDVVRHIAGGPQMLVQPENKLFQVASVANGMKGYISCKWHTGKEFKSGFFHPSALEHIQEAQPDAQ